MNTVWTVLMVILFILLPIYRRARKQLDANQPSPRRRGGMVGSADEDADVEEGTPFEVDGLGEPVFSYEYGEGTEQVAPKTARRPQPAPARKQPQPAVAVEVPAMQFDLRQAVIYQTVLNNPYIPEINQSIQ